MDGDVYLPLKMSQAQDLIYEHEPEAEAGVSIEAAEAELRPLMQQFDKERPNYYPAQYRIVRSKDG